MLEYVRYLGYTKHKRRGNLDPTKDMIDPHTGILLTPSYHGEQCLGDGKHDGYECCCDECNYYLICFPD